MKKVTLISTLGIVGLLITMDSCMQFRLSTTEIDERFKARKTKGTQATFQYEKRTIHYAKTGRDEGPIVLFVHGSPGSLSDFIGFLCDSVLQSRAQLISIDRPGFGQSGFGRGEPSMEQQSKIIKHLIDILKKDKPIILVGYSLGGPLIAKVASDYPGLINGLIFVAGSVDPDLEPPNWWRAPLATSFFRWIIPRSLRASNDEIYPLKKQLKELSGRWNLIDAKATIIHGTKDSLVPFGNAAFIEEKLESNYPKAVYEEGMDHFVPWTHPHLIKNAVIDMLDELLPN